MALSDVYQLIVRQTLFGRNVENVFFYEKLDPAGTAEDLIAGFGGLMSIAMRTIQSEAVTWVAEDCKSLGDPTDFSTLPLALPGLGGAGDTLPAFNAIGFTLNPATRLVRPGSKRIAGILEAAQINGVITLPGWVDAIEDFRILLDDNAVGTLSEYQPVIVKRVKTPIPDTVPPKFRYSLPEAGDPLVLGLVKSATSNLTITSQVSRKD